MSIVQRNATRNQSTADYSSKCIFLFDNRFMTIVLVLAAQTVLKEGMLIAQASDGTFVPATAANLANVVGILKMDGDYTAPIGNITVNIGTKGTIDETGLVLPATVTLATMVGNKSLRMVLEGLGFHMEPTIEHTEFEQ